jgi:hypothetical protein
MYATRVRAVGEDRESYNYTYDLFVRRYPDVVKAAMRISSTEASTRLLARAVELAGALTSRQAQKLFDWDEERVARTALKLEASRQLARARSGRDEMLVLPALLG